MNRILFCILFFCFAAPLWSQPTTQEQLEERKAKIQQEIHEKEKLLQTVKTKEKSVVTQLQLQKEKIGLKEKLIKTTIYRYLLFIKTKITFYCSFFNFF